MKLKKLTAMLLAAALTLGCVTTAFAANIDFDSSTISDNDGSNSSTITDGATGNSWSVANDTITTSDVNNTVSGDGNGWSINFTDPDANVEVNGDVTVGGIVTGGNLTIDSANPSGDNLNVTDKGTTVNGTLTIDGGVTLDSTNNAGNGVYANDIYVKDGAVIGTGASSYDGILAANTLSNDYITYDSSNMAEFPGNGNEKATFTSTDGKPVVPVKPVDPVDPVDPDDPDDPDDPVGDDNDDPVNLRNGWVKENGKTYYYIDGRACIGWKKIDGSSYYFDEHGVMKSEQWLKDTKGNWYWLKPNGVRATGWEKINGSWYYFDASGVMQTGWVEIRGIFYYLKSNGVMYEGWLQDGNDWYYLTPGGGAMTTGRITINGRASNFSASGRWLGYV